ncbi:anthrax toxin-like adenylyl cyclase domain-containing protein [Azospirillum palustre]|nr:anthrax toxin-like adenylyl cyclase domain-containing protein [Azospirillum palustre]
MPAINSGAWHGRYRKAIKSSSMLPHHAAGFATVANTRKEVIIVRNVNEHAQPWIKMGCPTKDMHIKGKSASWGPHAGLIPEKQEYSKLTDAGDVKKYNTKVKKLLAEKPPAAKALPLRIPPPNGEPVTVHANLAPPPSEVMKVGEHYYRAGPPGEKMLSDAVKPVPDGEPLTVLADPVSGMPITADYDLLAIGRIPPEDRPPSKIINDDDVLGTLSRSEKKTLRALQRATETPGRGRPSQRVVHHGPENRNPDEKIGRLSHSDFPMASYMPDGSVRSIESEQQLLDLFNDMNAKGYNLSPHPGWGWGDPSGGRYALPE